MLQWTAAAFASSAAAALLLTVPAARAAEDPLPGPVAALVLRVVDGDTFEVSARIWLGQRVTTLVRIDGVDAPELRARCDAEATLAARATEALAELVLNRTVWLTDIRNDKYGGRIVAAARLPTGEDVGAWLVNAGLARVYAGGTRTPWCPDIAAGG